MKRYHYIDEQGNISDALPLAALHKIELTPATKVLLEGGKQWITLAEASENGSKISTLTSPPIAATSNVTSSNVAAQSSIQYPCPHCKNVISVDAKICGHCQKETPLGKRTPGIVRMVLGSLFLVAALNSEIQGPKSADELKRSSSTLQLFSDENVQKMENESHKNGVNYNLILGAILFVFGWNARKEHKQALAAIKLIRAS